MQSTRSSILGTVTTAAEEHWYFFLKFSEVLSEVLSEVSSEVPSEVLAASLALNQIKNHPK